MALNKKISLNGFFLMEASPCAI